MFFRTASESQLVMLHMIYAGPCTTHWLHYYGCTCAVQTRCNADVQLRWNGPYSHVQDNHCLILTVAHFAGAEHLLLLPARLHLQCLTCSIMDDLLAHHTGRNCSIAAVLKQIMLPAERSTDLTPQLMLVLLQSARLDTLNTLCRAFIEAECGARVAALLAKAIRYAICRSSPLRNVVLADTEGLGRLHYFPDSDLASTDVTPQ